MNTTINDFLRSPFCNSQPPFVQEICSNLQALLLVCQFAVPEFTMELFKPGIFEAAATPGEWNWIYQFQFELFEISWLVLTSPSLLLFESSFDHEKFYVQQCTKNLQKHEAFLLL